MNFDTTLVKHSLRSKNRILIQILLTFFKEVKNLYMLDQQMAWKSQREFSAEFLVKPENKNQVWSTGHIKILANPSFAVKDEQPF